MIMDNMYPNRDKVEMMVLYGNDMVPYIGISIISKTGERAYWITMESFKRFLEHNEIG